MRKIFKKGDRVRAVKAYDGWLTVGNEYQVVTGNDTDRSNVIIVFSPEFDDNNGAEGGFNVSRFEKVEPVTKTKTTTTNSLTLKDGTYGDITVIDGLITKNKSVLAAASGNEFLVDVGLRYTASVEAHNFIDSLNTSVAKAGMTVRYVEDIHSYFDAATRYKQFLADHSQTSGIEITDEEKAAFALVDGVKAKFKAAFNLPEMPKIPYVKLPEKGNPLANYTFTKTSIRKSTGYAASVKQGELIWKAAREAWRGRTSTFVGRITSNGPIIRAAGYNRRLSIYSDRIELGCQSVTRAELEAIATKMNWEF